MDQFEYLSVLSSIVIGLGLTGILIGIGRLLKQRGEVTLYWVHSLQIATTFLFLINSWWVLFNWSQFAELTFFHNLFLLARPVCLFLAAVLLFPNVGSESVSLRNHYFENHRAFYVLLSLRFPLDVVDTALKGLDRFDVLGWAYLPMILFGFVITILAAITRSPRYHSFVQPALLTYFFITVVFWKINLGSNLGLQIG